MSQGSTIDDRAPDGDISLGRELRRAREVRGISVQQIAQETKINERYIHALENDRLDLLPGQPYTANFVRSIARCIGADEEELIDYLNYHLRLQSPERRDDLRSGGSPRPRHGLPIVLLLGAVLVVVALTMALRGDKREAAPRTARDPRPAASATLPVMASPAAGPTLDASGAVAGAPVGGAAPVLGTLAPVTAPAPAAVSAPAPATASAPEAASAPVEASAPVPAPTVRLVWRAKGWIQAEQGADFYARMRQAGDELSWTLDDPLSLQIGNSGQVDMFIDGQPAKPLGGENETRRLVLDSRNWKTFLR